MPQPLDVSPEEYASTFENTPTGQRVLEDLTRRFCVRPVLRGGIDGIRENDFTLGGRAVVEFILQRINQASGAEPRNDNDKEI